MRFLLPVRAALFLVAAFLPAASQAQTCSGSNLLKAMAEQDPQRLAQIESHAASVPNGDGLLWRVESDGASPSYLFGTVHLTDDRLTDLPQPVRDALQQSSRVLVENTDVFDPQASAAAMAANAQHVSFTDGDKLSAYLSEADKKLLGQFFGGTLAPVEQMKPWMLAVALAVPACEIQRRTDHKVVDAVIAEYATANRLELVGLESIGEQLSAFDGIPLADQVEFLMSTAQMINLRDDMFATMGDLYIERRIALIDALSRDVSFRTGISQDAYDAFTRELLHLRNTRMAERAESHVAKGGTFIAVGALHLPGETGLVEEFRKRGYQVTRIY